MNSKPYLTSDSYFPKGEHFDDVLNMLIGTSEMIKLQCNL